MRENSSRIGACESSRPELSANVIVFGCGSCLTGVIAAQSQQTEILGPSPKISGVKKNDLATCVVSIALHCVV